MTTLLLVEDHALMVKALSQALSNMGQIEVAGTAGNAEQAISQLKTLSVDLVLVDVSLPTMSGIDLVKEIRSRYPDLPCLMLSGHMAKQYVTRSLQAGARGYVLKDDIIGILEGIQRVMEGEIYVSEELRGG